MHKVLEIKKNVWPSTFPFYPGAETAIICGTCNWDIKSSDYILYGLGYNFSSYAKIKNHIPKDKVIFLTSLEVGFPHTG